MKRNGRNMKMQKDDKMYLDLWSQMKNQGRYDYLNGKITIEVLQQNYSK